MTDMREELAKIIYVSMAWAFEDGSGNKYPPWVKAAADTHYRTRIMAAFGLSKQEGTE